MLIRSFSSPRQKRKRPRYDEVQLFLRPLEECFRSEWIARWALNLSGSLAARVRKWRFTICQCILKFSCFTWNLAMLWDISNNYIYFKGLSMQPAIFIREFSGKLWIFDKIWLIHYFFFFFLNISKLGIYWLNTFHGLLSLFQKCITNSRKFRKLSKFFKKISWNFKEIFWKISSLGAIWGAGEREADRLVIRP